MAAEKTIQNTVVVFFRDHQGALYRANLLTDQYRRLSGPEAQSHAEAALTASGVPYFVEKDPQPVEKYGHPFTNGEFLRDDVDRVLLLVEAVARVLIDPASSQTTAGQKKYLSDVMKQVGAQGFDK